MRRPILLVMAAGSLAAMTACGPADTSASSSSTGAPTTSAVIAAPTVSTQAPPSQAPTSAPFVAFAMPTFVGMDLQSAQNGVQSHGIFFSKSHDLRGSRHQILDSDWIVCTQNVAPGQQVTSEIEAQIDFGVVKRSETCP